MLFAFEVKSSGLPVWKHHPVVCPNKPAATQEDKDTKEIADRIKKWKKTERGVEREAHPLSFRLWKVLEKYSHPQRKASRSGQVCCSTRERTPSQGVLQVC